MKRYMLDGNTINQLAMRNLKVLARVLAAKAAGHAIGTCLPLIAEYFGGVMASSSVKKNLPIARDTVDSLRRWPFEYEAAEEYARLYAELRRKGITIGAIDLQAAAVARTLGNCTVITCDSDFSFVPGLAVENWMASEPHE